MGVLRELLVLCAIYGCIRAITVSAPVGTCINKKAYGYIGSNSGDCLKMGGRFNGSPGINDWIDCFLDWCDIPSSGPVATGYVWGFDPDQRDKERSDSRTLGAVMTTRIDCDHMSGSYHGNPTGQSWQKCHLFMKRMDGTNRKNVQSIVFDKKCSPRVGFGAIYMKHHYCTVMGGSYHGDPGANDIIACHLDMCLSPVIKCEPSDSWSTIQVCRNPSSSSFKCGFMMRIGVEKRIGSSDGTGGSTSVAVSAEMGVELWGIFSSSLSLSTSTGFNWSKSQSSSQMWSQVTTRTLEVNLDPKQSVSINQVVGKCGNFHVDTTEYKVVDIPNSYS